MQLVQPKVFLIAETSLIPEGRQDFLDFLGVPTWKTDAANAGEELCEIAGKLCYMSFSTDLNKNLTRTGARNNHEYLQKGIIATKHGSVLEHSTVTLALMNISRIVTHELVRHRQGAAFSQLSGRYVRLDEVVMAEWPSCFKQDEVATDLVNEATIAVESAVQKLSKHFNLDNSKDFGFKKEVTSAIRRIIGNGQSNHIIATFNHRAIRHIIETRTNRHAEEEIRVVFGKVFEQVSERYPAIYADAKVELVNNIPEVVFENQKV